MASGSYDNTVRIWELDSGTSQLLEGHTKPVEDIAFHENGRIIASSSSDHTIRIWNVDTGKTQNVLRGHQNIVTNLTFSQKDNILISGSNDRTLRLWDTESGVTLRVLHNLTTGVTDVATHGENIFSSSNDGTIKRWKYFANFPMEIIDLDSEPASTAISQSDSTIAVGYANGDLQLFSEDGQRKIWELKGAHNGDIQRLDFSPDGSLLATAGFDNELKLWNTRDGSQRQSFDKHENVVHDVKFSPDGKYLATASYDGKIGLFEIGNEKGIFYKAHEKRTLSIAFDSTGRKLISAGDDGRTVLWNLSSAPPRLEHEFPQIQDQLNAAAISPNGELVASVGRDSIIRVYKTNDQKEFMRLVGHENTVFRLSFSPDNNQIFSVSSDATIRIWDLENGSEICTLQLPAIGGTPTPLWDFDFEYRRSKNGSIGPCTIAIPLTRGKLVIYDLGSPYQ